MKSDKKFGILTKAGKEGQLSVQQNSKKDSGLHRCSPKRDLAPVPSRYLVKTCNREPQDFFTEFDRDVRICQASDCRDSCNRTDW